ncbi:branched-chain amino acid aminotransferase [Kitasatospora sp. KL5]|uniref:branched-chain amino acid aminotransferase n=1 Tax=Kitasatospora sp. KL5 TaxID=3425125 RepID=UPI003D6FA2E1
MTTDLELAPPHPAADGPGPGEAFTDHMVVMDWTEADGWSAPRLSRLANLSLHPGTLGLHYGQVVFEGLKAHRRADGTVGVWRPHDHALRFRSSCRRMAMPELPEDAFTAAAHQLVRADEGFLPADGSRSLYLRPLMFGSDASLMLRPSRSYRFLMMAFVTGGFFGDRAEPVAVHVSRDHVRAVPGGTGAVKVAGNYAPTFLAQRAAEAAGCRQVVWLDAVERRWVEELGGMNLFLVRGRGEGAEVVTPELTQTLLPGVTRSTLLTLAGRLGHRVVEERIPLDRWREECEAGTVTEAFACGTWAVVTPVGRVRDGDGGWTVGDGRPGPVTTALHRLLTGLHHGLVPDEDGWFHPSAR